LEPHPILQRTKIMTDVEAARGPHAAKDATFCVPQFVLSPMRSSI